MEDFNNFITKLKWQIATKEFVGMQKFTTDCFVYSFNPPLNADQLDAFLDFIGDSERLHHITPVDFCNYFLCQHISFDFHFQFVGKVGLYKNIRCWKIVRKIQKELKKNKGKECRKKHFMTASKILQSHFKVKKSILVICQEIFEKDFDMFFLKKGALHHRS